MKIEMKNLIFEASARRGKVYTMNKKIKIAEFVTRLEFGGVESVLLNYLGHFKNGENFDIHIVTQDINDPNCIELFRNRGYTVHVVTHKRKSMRKNIAGVYKILKKEKFDVVHSHMTLTNFYVLFLAWVTGTKLRISHSHNAFKSGNLIKKSVWAALKVVNQMTANKWMACGYDAGVFLFGKKAMDCNKVFVMNNAIDINRFAYDQTVRDEIRSQYQIGDSLCIGHVGRFMRQKNHRFLLEIFSEIKKKNPDATLLLVGSGELEGEIKDFAKSLEIDGAVIFTGNVSNSNEFYQAMDVFVLPSLYEGLPIVSIEAQCADLPCVISDRVDTRCRLTDNVELLSIEKPASVWAKEVLKCVDKRRTHEVLHKIKDNHYSIDDEAENLERIYSGA